MERQEQEAITRLKRLLDAAVADMDRPGAYAHTRLRLNRDRQPANDAWFLGGPTDPRLFLTRLGAKKRAKRFQNVLFFPMSAKRPATIRPAGNPRRYWGSLDFARLVAGDRMLTPSHTLV